MKIILKIQLNYHKPIPRILSLNAPVNSQIKVKLVFMGKVYNLFEKCMCKDDTYEDVEMIFWCKLNKTL
jgi:hypothetical protein